MASEGGEIVPDSEQSKNQEDSCGDKMNLEKLEEATTMAGINRAVGSGKGVPDQEVEVAVSSSSGGNISEVPTTHHTQEQQQSETDMKQGMDDDMIDVNIDIDSDSELAQNMETVTLEDNNGDTAGTGADTGAVNGVTNGATEHATDHANPSPEKVSLSANEAEEAEGDAAVTNDGQPGTEKEINDDQHEDATPDDDDEQPKPKNPLEYMRKAGVAVAGGTLVVVGAIMIPLPTPFGAVIAGSGMAVLGTEFESANKVNKQVVSKAKEHFQQARTNLATRIKRTAESMDEHVESDGDDTAGNKGKQKDGGKDEKANREGESALASSDARNEGNTTSDGKEGESETADATQEEQNETEALADTSADNQHDAVRKESELPPSTSDNHQTTDTMSEPMDSPIDSSTSHSDGTTEQFADTKNDGGKSRAPRRTRSATSWLALRPSERKRIQQQQQEQRRQEQQSEAATTTTATTADWNADKPDQSKPTSFQNARKYFRKRTATFLTGTLLPLVQQKETPAHAAEDDADVGVTITEEQHQQQIDALSNMKAHTSNHADDTSASESSNAPSADDNMDADLAASTTQATEEIMEA